MSSSAVLLLFLAPATVVVAWRPWPKTVLNTTITTGKDGSVAMGLGASKKCEGSSEFVHLRYHMDPVLTAHPMWYGAWTPAQKHIIRAFLHSISPPDPAAIPSPSVSAWWRTVPLYTDQTIL